MFDRQISVMVRLYIRPIISSEYSSGRTFVPVQDVFGNGEGSIFLNSLQLFAIDHNT